MCDYSLNEYNNRLAVVNELLMTHRFASGTVGLTTPRDREESRCVCVPHGARLSVRLLAPDAISGLGLGVGPHLVRFVQTGLDAGGHRDALQFENGRTISLQFLGPARFEVLALSADDAPAEEPKPEPVQTAEEPQPAQSFYERLISGLIRF